jgi:hypothetical protein
VTTYKYRLMAIILLGLTSFVLCSCGTDTVVKFTADGDEQGDVQIGPGDSGSWIGDVWTPNKPDGYKPNPIRYKIVLKHDTSVPLNLLVGDKQPIMAHVIDYEESMPAINYPVKFTMTGANPECDTGPPDCGFFEVKEGMTNALGNVSVSFHAGPKGNVLYSVELSGQQAEPDGMDIQVNDLPTGNLKVKLKYDGPVPIKNIKVRVMPGYKTCSDYNPVNPWVEGLVGDKTVPGLDSVPSFNDIDVAQTFVVFATGEKKDTGALAASGCIDAVHVKPSEQGDTIVTLSMYVLTLNPSGTYDTLNHFDFTDAIPGQAGEVITFIVELFYNPGKIIIDLIKELVAQYVGGWVTDIVFGLFEDALADVVTDWLLNNSPDFIQDLFVIGQDLVQIVKNVELQSELKLSKLSNDYYFQGLQNWIGINLYWKLGCAKEGEPGYDPECGKNPFSLKDLQDSDVPLDLISGQFTGMIANYDNLIIDSHKIDLNYGKLVLFVINEMLLPAISDYNSIEDLLYSIIDCKGVADGIVGDVLDAIGIDNGTVEDACTSVVSFIVSPIEELIMGLTIDSKLRINGSCRMVDLDNDLMVDELLEGVWYGTVEIGAEEGSQFEGDFTGVKAVYPGQ